MRTLPFRRLAALVVVLFVSFALAAIGCTKPDPPVLTPKSAKVSSVSLAGVALELEVEAYNPNSVALSAQSVTGKVVLDGKVDLGSTTVNKPASLPAGARTTLTIPMSLGWNDLAGVAQLAASNRNVPFTIDGTVTVGGERLNVDLPFYMTGSLTHDELVKATMRSMPPLPQGLKLPL